MSLKIHNPGNLIMGIVFLAFACFFIVPIYLDYPEEQTLQREIQLLDAEIVNNYEDLNMSWEGYPLQERINRDFISERRSNRVLYFIENYDSFIRNKEPSSQFCILLDKINSEVVFIRKNETRETISYAIINTWIPYYSMEYNIERIDLSDNNLLLIVYQRNFIKGLSINGFISIFLTSIFLPAAIILIRSAFFKPQK